MSEQVGTHSVPIGGGDDRERPPELETPRSAAAPFEPVGSIPQMDQKRGRGWRPWAIIGVAIAVPAAVAAVLVTTLGSSDTPAAQQAARAPAPAPVVEQSTTIQPPAAPVRTAAPVSTAPATPDRATVAGTASTASATPTVSRADAAAAAAASESAGTAAAAEVAELATPQERLYAWADTTQVTVVEGDSLWGLALEYSTTVEAISMLNGISDPSELSVGAVLSIPAGFAESLAPVEQVVVEESAGSSETAASMATRFETTPPAETPLADWPNVVEWTIQPGDSLSALATTFETTPEAIMTLNSIADANLVYAGTTIRIPVGYSGGEAAAAAETTGASEETTSEPETTTTQQAATTNAADELEGAATTQQAATTNAADELEEAATTQQAATTNAADELEEAAAPANENTGGDSLEEESSGSGSSDGGDSLEQ